MPGRHPCERGQRCSCHRAGPSTLPRKKTILAAAALVCPVLAAPTPPPPSRTHLPFLYPSLDKRAKDAGQAPDDPSEGFTHQHIQLADLIRAGLPYKYVYDPAANANIRLEEEGIEIKEGNGAWVIDNSWSLHGRRFGPLYATATAGITDDPLPTPTESISPASTPTPTPTSVPTILAIQSSLPTGWDSTQYARSDMYAIPLVVSFSLVIALMIGSLIGALVIRRDRSRSRRRKKRIIQGDDDSAREKVAQSSLVSRVGRALKHRDAPEEEEEENPRTELEHRVKSWARRSAAWRVQARIGVRRRMGRGRKRSQADNGPGPMGGAIQEEPEAEEMEARQSTRASTPAQSRAPTPIVTEQEPPPSAAPNYSSPVVPTYSSPPTAGPSTPPEARIGPLTRMEAHPDATPSDEPAYDGPGSGEGLPPAYRGGGLSEVARGKRPARVSSESLHEPEREERTEERRVWTDLDAYAYGQEPTSYAEGMVEGVTAHVATDDKRILERLHSMRGAPEEGEGYEEGQAPREEDVWGPSTPSSSFPSTNPSSSGVPTSASTGVSSTSADVLLVMAPSSGTGTGASLPPPGPGLPPTGTGALPPPPTKTGTGPVARYDEADLCLPKYLDGEGMPGGGTGMGVPSGLGGLGVPSAPEGVETIGGMVPSAPPCEEDMALPSAPSLEDVSAPPLDDHFVPSAPPVDDYTLPSAPPMNDYTPSTPPMDDHTPSAPSLDDRPSTPSLLQNDAHPDDKASLHPSSQPSAPPLRRLNSSSPLLSEEQ